MSKAAGVRLATRATPLLLSDGTVEALKWLALALMVLDHSNKWLLGGEHRWMYEAGRLVAPIFAFVLAYNLARPEPPAGGRFERVLKRLALYATLATPPFAALVGGWWPLNILFTLFASAFIVFCLRRGSALWIAAGGCTFAAAGVIAEFFVPAILMFGAAWLYCRHASTARLVLWALSVASLQLINGTPSALLVVPLVLLAAHVSLRVPRAGQFFYAAYPVHLAAIWMLAVWR
jgi:hypothetical protein